MNWEESVLQGIDARQQRDGAQWALGDLANELDTTYGDETLAKYAEAIGVERRRLMSYRTVARAFEKSVRTENLPWSIYERLASRPDRLRWLKKAGNENWSVNKLREELYRQDPNGQEAFIAEPPDSISELLEIREICLEIQNFAMEKKIRAEYAMGQLLKDWPK